MTLIVNPITTPIGTFTMFIKRDNATDTVVVSGFSDAGTLQKRLPLMLQALIPEEVSDHPYAKAVQDYFDGNLNALATIPYEQTGSSYSQAVWKAMCQIPAGRTHSYKQLATASQNPKASRAAGSACANNTVTLLIPCHRVVRSDGKIGNYYYGTQIKQYLLDHEAKYARS